LDKKIVRVMFAVPNEGGTEPEAYDDRMCFTARLGMLHVLSEFGLHEFEEKKFDYPEGHAFKFHIATIGKVFTALARERLAEAALEANMDYLLMIDDDMLCPVDIFERLYKHNVDIVAPLAFSRYPPHKPVIYRVNSGIDPMTRKPFYINYPVLNYPRNQLVECDAVGFGAVLIKCDVLKKIPKPRFMVTSGAGEDIHFCYMAAKEGYKVYMDTSIKLGHLGMPRIITEETYDADENQALLKDEVKRA
jgi:hypothetical protein